jgi:predicted site-specific integrase-resolvase
MATENMLSELAAAVRLGISQRTMRRIREEGRISYTRIGAGERPSVYYTEDDLQTYLANNRVEVAPLKSRKTRAQKAS